MYPAAPAPAYCIAYYPYMYQCRAPVRTRTSSTGACPSALCGAGVATRRSFPREYEARDTILERTQRVGLSPP